MTEKKKLTLVPVGGLANRMRAIDSAIALAKDSRHELEIVWFKDQGLNARFCDLFQPFELPGVTLRESGWWDKLLLDRPRKKNLYLPGFFQKCLFDDCLYESRTKENALDYLSWADSTPSAYLASYNHFYRSDCYRQLSSLFRPLPALQEQIDRICLSFTGHTVGIHIRRGDNVNAIKRSPLSLFVKAIEERIRLEEKAVFYVASDSEADKQELVGRFGHRIIASTQHTNRDSLMGIQGAVVDLYALSRTHTIWGSFYSSFSEIAARLGNGSLQLISTQIDT